MNRTVNVTLDVAKRESPDDVAAVIQQGENASLTIAASVVIDGEPFDLTGKTARFACIKPDGKSVLSDATVADAARGLVDYDVSSAVASVPGNISVAYFILADETGWSATTECMAIRVTRGIDVGNVVSSDEYQTIAKLVGEIERQRDEFGDGIKTANRLVEEARASAESQKSDFASAQAERDKTFNEAEQTRCIEETRRSSSESARANAELKRDASERERASSEQARAEAEENRANSERDRASAENKRNAAEKTRASEEAKRASAEDGRAAAEDKRIATFKAQLADWQEQVNASAVASLMSSVEFHINAVGDLECTLPASAGYAFALDDNGDLEVVAR